ncbi:ABC transporter substrate-binding protein [Quadrisphaera sp. DSM 44207]|uniref:ABC transporter substrate-binding protein n=1 Tax=Quadrisphaera sp. DSM 44207 TaxID=1881057 RepID=UPI0008846646|nr:ABC transporter substrate-binding protein [Quadrisphaera sp. DSM 44207]SDQ16789.1 osmoprotectant transport system substrate-binding protein [Quadrisphaera sp. DSM 44207]
MPSTRARLRALPLIAAGTLLLAGCGGGGDPLDPSAGGSASSSSAAGGGGGTVVVGGAGFTESQVLQEMYTALLEDAGYTVETVTADNRELYYPALQSGEIDVIPEYAATLAEFVNRSLNGPDAPQVASADVTATVEALQAQLEAAGGRVSVLEPAEAASQNAFAVARATAEADGLATLSDLAALGRPIRLAATEECPTRPLCEPGLEQTYGLDITQVLPLGYSSIPAKQAVQQGQADLALVGSTDATVEQFDLVVLEDDRGVQLADNVIPAVSSELADDEQLAGALDSLSAVLTTDDLAQLNAQVDAERQLPADVARAYLEEQGLVGG